MNNMKDYNETYKNFNIDIPEYFNYGFDVIDKQAEENNKTALIWIDTDGKTHKNYTFADLKEMSNRFANLLINQGLKKGDNLYVMIPRIPEWYAVMLGCFKLGVIPMPAPKILQEKDIDYRLRASGAKGAVVYGESLEKFSNLSLPHDFVKISINSEKDSWQDYTSLMEKQSGTLSRDDIVSTASTDPLIIYFTSGTTKFPKMVLHDQTYALGHYITARFWQDLGEDDIHWTLSDTGWGKAVWGKLFGQWIIGATVVMHNQADRFDPELHLNILQNFGITTFCAPPTAYRMLILQDLSKYDFSRLRHSVSAGEPLNPEVMKKWEKSTGTLIYDGYGQTETVAIVANYPCLKVKPGSMGKPAPGFHVDVVDDDAKTMPLHEAGHIAVKVDGKYPAGVFKGYYRDEKATKQAFKNGWYFTGDKAYKDEEGYFWFVGRSDDVIKSSGYRVGPFEVESALQSHKAVAESAVIGSPDKLRGTIVKAFIVLKPGFQGNEELIKDIQNHVKKETAPYKYPREIEFVEELPKTVSGKIRRVELRQMEEKRKNTQDDLH